MTGKRRRAAHSFHPSRVLEKEEAEGPSLVQLVIFGKSPEGVCSDEDKKGVEEGVYISIYPLGRYSKLALKFGGSRVGSHEGEWSPFWYDNPTPALSMNRSLTRFGRRSEHYSIIFQCGLFSHSHHPLALNLIAQP